MTAHMNHDYTGIFIPQTFTAMCIHICIGEGSKAGRDPTLQNILSEIKLFALVANLVNSDTKFW